MQAWQLKQLAPAARTGTAAALWRGAAAPADCAHAALLDLTPGGLLLRLIRVASMASLAVDLHAVAVGPDERRGRCVCGAGRRARWRVRGAALSTSAGRARRRVRGADHAF